MRESLRKLFLLTLPCAMLLLSGCGDDYGSSTSYETTSSGGGYATSGTSTSGSKYSDSATYSTSVRDSAPFGNYPINRSAPSVPCPNCVVPR